jgi:ABC-type Fe3+-hydroxamate transport system substrate-binding protein
MTLLRVSDDRGRPFDFAAAPMRIVSLVPSDTFSVAALGCGARLVGRTDYCELPEDVARRVPAVGGTKNPRLDDICDLAPDLVLANQEENARPSLEGLARRGIRVFVAFPKRVSQGLAHLARLARILDVASEDSARGLVESGYQALRRAEAARAVRLPLPTFCPIWMDPLMTIHADTFVSDMLDMCGAENVFADRRRRYPLAADLGHFGGGAPKNNNNEGSSAEAQGDRDTRYPRITLEEVVARAPALVLLPDEPHAFTDADAAVFRSLPIPAAQRGTIVPVSGKDLTWYGARSVDALPRCRALVDAAAR